MSVYDVLAQAIEERRVVTFTYDGFLHVVEPFLLGTTTAGRSALRAYQTAGGSRSGTDARVASVLAWQNRRPSHVPKAILRRVRWVQPL